MARTRTRSTIEEKIEAQKLIVSKAKDKYEAAVNELERLEPCGAQNAKPMICIRNARMSNPRIFKEKVFSATIADTNIKCLWFTPAIPYSEFTSQPLNLVGEMLREKTGTSTVYKLIIRDACPASADVFI